LTKAEDPFSASVPVEKSRRWKTPRRSDANRNQAFILFAIPVQIYNVSSDRKTTCRAGFKTAGTGRKEQDRRYVLMASVEVTKTPFKLCKRKTIPVRLRTRNQSASIRYGFSMSTKACKIVAANAANQPNSVNGILPGDQSASHVLMATQLFEKRQTSPSPGLSNSTHKIQSTTRCRLLNALGRTILFTKAILSFSSILSKCRIRCKHSPTVAERHLGARPRPSELVPQGTNVLNECVRRYVPILT
jgi:hypothetical protein